MLFIEAYKMVHASWKHILKDVFASYIFVLLNVKINAAFYNKKRNI